MKEALWNVEKLMSFVGVDQAPVEPSDADTCGINRYSYIEFFVVVEFRSFGAPTPDVGRRPVVWQNLCQKQHDMKEIEPAIWIR